MPQRTAYQPVALELSVQPSTTNDVPEEELAAVSLSLSCQQQEQQQQQQQDQRSRRRINRRTIATKLGISFWSIGVLNNAGYVIMIASAKSISEGGVGLVFLANILPALAVKASAPYWFETVSYRTRLKWATAFMVVSFLVVAYCSNNLLWQLGGVACTSAQGSLGEASLLALAGKIDGELAALDDAIGMASSSSSSKAGGVCLNSFSSGTGFAGVFGFFWVWFFTHTLGLSLSGTMLLAIGLAGGYFYSYQCISGLSQHIMQQQQSIMTMVAATSTTTTTTIVANHRYNYRDNDNENGDAFHDEEDEEIFPEATTPISSSNNNNSNNSSGNSIHDNKDISSTSGKERFFLVLGLWPYTVPLFTVYVAEYTLQSGTWTAIGFPVTDQESRDRFYQYSNWLYQVGVFVSRSSGTCGNVAPMAILWIMPLLQCVNVLVYWSVAAQDDSDSQTTFWHSSYFLYPAALYSGLLGGAVYIHGYLRICKDLPLARREFALSATSLAECLGIVVADGLGLVVQACLYQLHGLDGAAMACPKQ